MNSVLLENLPGLLLVISQSLGHDGYDNAVFLHIADHSLGSLMDRVDSPVDINENRSHSFLL